jgi:hypothetical protein
VQLTDKDNRPVNVDVTPGTATAVSTSSLSVTTNSGASRTFSLDDKTAIHGAAHGQSNQTGPQAVKQNDHVVVVTLNGSATATAVIVANADGFGPRGPLGH